MEPYNSRETAMISTQAPFFVALAGAFLIMLPACGPDEPGQSAASNPGASNPGAGNPGGDNPGSSDTGGSKTEKAADPAAAAAAKKKRENARSAKEVFTSYCHTCHGLKGKGDGIAGLSLNPRPRNWTDEKWQASVTDEKILKVIFEGGQANGLSGNMAPNPFHRDNEDVQKELVNIVRSFRPRKR